MLLGTESEGLQIKQKTNQEEKRQVFIHLTELRKNMTEEGS